MTAFSLPLLAAALLVALLPAAASAQRDSEPPLIHVSGQAEIRVAPDEVYFTLEVERLDKDLPTAQRLNDESVRQILAIARRFNVPAEDVKTAFITVEMKYSTDRDDDDDEDRPPARREFVGYQVSKTAVVRFADLRRFDEFFSEVLRAGVSRVRNLEFRTAQIRKYKDQARALAVRAAREKAVALTAELGQVIGKAHTITEQDERGSASSNNVSTVASGGFSADEGSAFAPGMITVTARVNVSFLLN
jgi:uncharacterized protein